MMIVSEIEITYNPIIKPSERVKITGAKEAAELFRSIWDKNLLIRESFYAMYLNRANKVLGFHLVSKGGVTGTVVDPKCVYQVALKANSTNVLVAHNHPSGNTEPSSADIAITRKLKEAGLMLDIQLLDHIILLPEGFISMANEGYV